MPRQDLDYYRNRLTVERHRAELAARPEVRHIHNELAARYAELIGEAPARTVAEPAAAISPAAIR